MKTDKKNNVEAIADQSRTRHIRWRNKTVCFLATALLCVFSLQVSAQIDPDDLDGDGIPNTVDIDDDNDGILDTDEGCIALALPAVPGTTTLGVPDSFTGPGFFQVISDSDVDGDTTIDPGQLFVYDAVNSQYTLIGGPEEINYNAIGYNVNDGFIYGIARAAGTDALGNAVAQWDVVRVDADGEVFFHVTPSQTINSFSADVTVLQNDFNDDNTANFIAAGTEVLTGFLGGDLFAIDLATGNTVRLNNNGTTPADVAVIGTSLYGVQANSTNLVVGDLTTGVKNIVPTTGDLPGAGSGGFGAVWTGISSVTGLPELYASSNTLGLIYRIDDFDTLNPTSTLVATAIPTGSNDGTSDPGAFSAIPPRDTDGDGVADCQDLDSDNDGVSDLLESGASAAILGLDANGDGTIDANSESDDLDGDGLIDAIETANGANSGTSPQDTDLDLIQDFIDLDSDNDTIPDATEARASTDYVPYVSLIDTDGDGILDIYDDNTDWGSTAPGTDFVSLPTELNADNNDVFDAIPDIYDDDSDGDGLLDSAEAGTITGVTYSDPDGDVDDPLGTSSLPNVDGDNMDTDFRSIFSEIGVSKSAGTPSLNDDGTFDVVYTLLIQNTGNTDLSDLSLEDNLVAQFNGAFTASSAADPSGGIIVAPVVTLVTDAPGTAVTLPTANAAYDGSTANMFTAAPNTLGIGDVIQVTFTARLDPNVAGATFDNTATASGEDVYGDTITDLSNDGTDPTDGSGGDDDPTSVVPPTQIPSLDIIKIAAPTPTVSGDDTFLQEFTINVVNTGNVTLTNLTLTDNIEALFGDQFLPSTAANPASGVLVAPTAITNTATGISGNMNFDGDTDISLITLAANAAIAPGEEITITFTVEFDATQSSGNENPDGTTSNSAVASGTPPSGVVLPPVSDSANIPAEVEPELGVVKSASVGSILADGTFNVTYTILVQNTGNVNLSPLSLVDDLTDPSQLGGAFDSVVSQPMITGTANSLPTAATYTGTNALIIGTDGLLAPSQNYQVVFTVNVDPNDDDAPANLTNTATASGTPPGGLPPIFDDSNTGSDADGNPTGENPGDDPNDQGGGEPTPITPPVANPELGVSKEAGTPTLNDDGTIDVPYTLLIQNTGDVDISDLTLVDDLEAQFGTAAFTASDETDMTGGVIDAPTVTVATDAVGTAIVLPTGNMAYAGDAANDDLFTLATSTLGVGDIIEVTFTVRLNPAAAGSTLENTATVGGTDPTGTDITDDSDSGSDPMADPGGPGTPTPVIIPALMPELGVSKAAGTPTLNADGTIDVPYTLLIQNTGDVDISDLTLVDDLETQFGTAAFTASDETDITGGVIVAPTVTEVTDAAGTAIVLPTGNMAYAGDAANDDLFTAATSTLGVGDIIEVTFTVRLNPAAAGSNVENTATVGGTDPAGTDITDDSDGGSDPTADPGGPGTPTPVIIPALMPELGVSKAANSPTLNADGTVEVEYTLLIENTGNVNLTNLTLIDDLEAQFGIAAYTGSDETDLSGGVIVAPAVTVQSDVSGIATAPTANALYTGAPGADNLFDGSSGILGLGDILEVTFTILLNPAAVTETQPLENTATAGATDPAGNDISDNSDSGSDPSADPGGPGTPTPITLTSMPELGVSKVAGTPTLNDDGSIDVPYTLLVQNTGNVDISNLTLVDDLETQFGTAAFTASDETDMTGGVIDAPTVTVATDAAGTAIVLPIGNMAYAGDAANDDLFTAAASTLGVGDIIEVTFTVRLNPAAAGSTLENTAMVGGTDPAGTGISDNSDSGSDPTADPGGPGTPTPVIIPALMPELGVSKAAGSPTFNDDGTIDVPYTLLIQNTGDVDISDLTLVDDLEAQFGTAAFTASDETDITGGVIAAPTVTVTTDAAGTAIVLPTGNMVYAGDAANDDLFTLATSTLGVGDIIEVTFTVRLNPAAAGSTLENTAMVGGTDPAGTDITDNSDSGSDPTAEPGGPGTPTPVVLTALMPELGISKAAGTPTVNSDGTIDVPYTLLVQNTGDVDVSNLTLFDDLATQFGAAAFTASDASVSTGGVIVEPTVSLLADAPGTMAILPTGNMSYDGSIAGLFTADPSLLGVGDIVQVTFTVRLNPAAAGMTLNNTAMVTGLDPAGMPVMDDSDSGSDPSINSGGPGSPTPVTLPLLEPSLIVSKAVAGTPIALGNGVYRVTYDFVIENNGNVDFTDLQLVDDLNAMINDPNPNGATVANAVVSYVSGTVLTPNPAYTGTGVNDMLSGTDSFPVGASTVLTLAFDFTPDVYFGPFNNTAQVSGVDPNGETEIDNSESNVAPTTSPTGDDIQSPTPFILNLDPTTPITLGWINIIDNLNGSALIEWQTVTEVANAGFHILVLNESDAWIKVNRILIESQGDSTSAQDYVYLSNLVGEEFMLVDVSVTGVEVRHGPFKLNESSGIYVTPKEIEWQRIQEESERKQEQREQQRRQQLQDRLSTTTSGFMKSVAAAVLSVLVPSAHAVDLLSFEVETAGLYQVTHQDLMATGLDLRGIELDRLGLEEAGVLWPMDKVQANGNTFNSSTTLLFPARGLDSLYSGVNKYTLVLDEGSVGINQDDTELPGVEIALAYSYLAEATYAPQNSYSYLSPESEDSWFADALNAINSPVSKSITLSVDGYAVPLSIGGGFGVQIQRQGTQNPELEVSLWGGSALPGNGVTNPDHHVLVELNDESLDDIRFDGLAHSLEQIPLASVAEGTNRVEITVPNDQGYLYDLIRLDHVTLRYPRTFDAQQGALVFESDWRKFRVSNLNATDARVVRLAIDQQGIPSAYYMTERGDGQCATGCVYFAGNGGVNSYFVASDVGLMEVPEISAAVDGSNMAAGQANFIIIAHPDFINTSSQSLEGYASEITAKYGSVDIVDVETIYAAYSGGVVDAYAIKDYISNAYENRGTRHILLVGGDSYDYQDYTNSGAMSFIPSIYQPISNNVKAVPSDSSYVLVDEDLSPDLTITRLPVRSTVDLDNLIAKRQNYLARNYQGKVLMAADEVDNSSYSFKSDVQSLISDHYASNNVNAVYLDDMDVAAARASVISALNGGVSLASYFGHSSTDRWSISSMLSGDDVAGLINTQSPTVVAQWGCWNTFYVSPEHDSMAHRFLLEGTQGAVTVMGASSFTEADAEKRMAEFLSANLQQGMSIGDAVMDAKQKIYAETPFQIDVLLGWAVLGFDDMTVFE